MDQREISQLGSNNNISIGISETHFYGSNKILYSLTSLRKPRKEEQ